jgi:hypothetical protein
MGLRWAGCLLAVMVGAVWSFGQDSAAAPVRSAVSAVSSRAAFDTIAGPLPKVVVNPGRPYYVVADIEVPADRLVKIEPGVVFLFKPFTGLHVQGPLDIRGTRQAPVVFTSENDRSFNPASVMVANPYDWNGVYVHPGAIGTTFSHTRVTYSVYGVVSETKFVKVEEGIFADNGKSNLVIENTERVTAAGPFSYVLSTKDAMVDGVPVKLLRDPAAPKRNTYRYAGLGLLLAGAALGVVELVSYRQADNQLSQLSSLNDSNLRYNTSKQWDDTHSTRTWSAVGSAAGFVVGVVGGAGLVWSFTF